MCWATDGYLSSYVGRSGPGDVGEVAGWAVICAVGWTVVMESFMV